MNLVIGVLKLRKRLKKRFEHKEAEIQAMIVHEKEMARKKVLRRERAFKERFYFFCVQFFILY